MKRKWRKFAPLTVEHLTPQARADFGSEVWTAFRFGCRMLPLAAAAMVGILILEAIFLFTAFTLAGTGSRYEAAQARGTIAIGVVTGAILLAKVILAAFLIEYFLSIVRATARGSDDAADIPVWHEDTIRQAIAKVLIILIVYVGPPVGLHVYMLLNPGSAWMWPVIVLLYAFGAGVLPMAMAAAASNQFVAALFLGQVVRTVLEHLGDYVRLLSVAALSLAPGMGVWGVLTFQAFYGDFNMLARIGLALLGWSAFVVGGFVGARAIGLFVRHKQRDLPWDFAAIG
jgi:hypothetical protein